MHLFFCCYVLCSYLSLGIQLSNLPSRSRKNTWRARPSGCVFANKSVPGFFSLVANLSESGTEKAR